MIGTAVAASGALASLAWLLYALEAGLHRRSDLFLADLPGDEPAPGWPRLAAVVAARDEAEHVEAAVGSLLAQDYPDLRVVAVDDRSTDGTAQILDRMAAGDARLRVVHVAQLPRGWLGKTHALQVGWKAAAADWVLFTDGDVVFEPGALRRGVRHAVEARLDHLAVIPDVPAASFGEKLFLAMFGLLFVLGAPPWRVANPRSRAFCGVGAFNLVRRAALAAAGGFDRIALSVDDDLRLGQILKWTGGRSGVRFGAGAVSVRWQVGLAAMIRGLEKNFLAALDFRYPAIAGMALFLPWIGAAPHLGLLAGPWWSRGLCAAGVAAIAMVLHAAGPRRRIEWHHALTLPLSALLLEAALAGSVWATLRQGGIRWRGRLYPLRELRAHIRERNAWLRQAALSPRRGP
jgi:hypothetical protein